MPNISTLQNNAEAGAPFKDFACRSVQGPISFELCFIAIIGFCLNHWVVGCVVIGSGAPVWGWVTMLCV